MVRTTGFQSVNRGSIPRRATEFYLFKIQIEKLRYAAKLTHRMYGINRYMVVLEILKNAIIVATMMSHRLRISTKAPRGLCKPKNRIDHIILRSSCALKTWMAVFLLALSALLFHTKNNAIPIRAKRAVHTGAKIQLGGAISGWTNV